MPQQTSLQDYFATFRQNIIGLHQTFDTPFGKKEIVYADWTASGRAYQPVENCIQHNILPFVGNTHTGTTVTGTLMTKAYEDARAIIKQHVNAGDNDALLFCGSGMTGAVNKLQRILGLRLPEQITSYTAQNIEIDDALRPLVFVTHMEHHSNHISWLETIATVEIIPCGDDGNVSINGLLLLLQKYRQHKHKIAAVTACSNVTGIETPYHAIAKLMHQHGGLCFVDFACSAPYVHIDMHPADKNAYLDAIYFSMHKFLGGPGTPGILISNKSLYNNSVPDQPGGGTVFYTNPWQQREYISDIEQREDGGTPPFIQAIKAAMCVRLKETMGIRNILAREKELVALTLNQLAAIKKVQVLQGGYTNRLGVVAFVIQGVHYNLAVKILNDRFGIQTRGGCSCAGTYGHKLLNVNKATSHQILQSLLKGDLQQKPGWIRLSLHPTMTDEEILFITAAIGEIVEHVAEWGEDYTYTPATNEYSFKGFIMAGHEMVSAWFK